jgi:hypothetical protein
MIEFKEAISSALLCYDNKAHNMSAAIMTLVKETVSHNDNQDIIVVYNHSIQLVAMGGNLYVRDSAPCYLIDGEVGVLSHFKKTTVDYFTEEGINQPINPSIVDSTHQYTYKYDRGQDTISDIRISGRATVSLKIYTIPHALCQCKKLLNRWDKCDACNETAGSDGLSLVDTINEFENFTYINIAGRHTRLFFIITLSEVPKDGECVTIQYKGWVAGSAARRRLTGGTDGIQTNSHRYIGGRIEKIDQ